MPAPIVLLAISLLLATVAGRVAAARAPGTPPIHVFALLVDMLFVGLFAGRLVFVLQWLPLYLADPWSIIRVGDGGYSISAAIVAALAFGAWRAWRKPALRRPLAWAALAGLGTWAMLAASLMLMQRATISLPETQLTRLEGGSVQLSDMKGTPVVVNLWATWCPPCRREMPVLAGAQQENPAVIFTFVNQGEGADDIRRYLQNGSLELQNVLLDPFSSTSRSTGARGLPTTLFFGQDGRLVDTHVGELTRASLAHKLQRFASDDLVKE